MNIFVCAKCFNPGGTLENKGTRKQPLYVHAQGRCKPINWRARNDIYQRLYHEFWSGLLNIGVDYERVIE